MEHSYITYPVTMMNSTATVKDMSLDDTQAEV